MWNGNDWGQQGCNQYAGYGQYGYTGGSGAAETGGGQAGAAWTPQQQYQQQQMQQMQQQYLQQQMQQQFLRQHQVQQNQLQHHFQQQQLQQQQLRQYQQQQQQLQQYQLQQQLQDGTREYSQQWYSPESLEAAEWPSSAQYWGGQGMMNGRSSGQHYDHAQEALDYALSTLSAPPDAADDGAREDAALAGVQALVAAGRYVDAHSLFLRMRELWREAETRFQSRGINFGQFNSKYQAAFRSLRAAAEAIRPARPGMLPQRRYVHVPSGELADGCANKPGAHCLRVMSFNILSEHADNLFSYQFVVLPKDGGDFLRWNVRCPMLVEEIGRWAPSIVCLQELDLDKRDSFAAALRARAGLELTRICKRHDRSKDGVSIAFDPQQLQLLPSSVEQVQLPATQSTGVASGNGGGILMKAVFEICGESHPQRGRRLGVLVTHVAGKEPACAPETMALLLKHMDELQCDCAFLAGDFNGLVQGALPLAEAAGKRSSYEAAGPLAMEAGGPLVTAHNDHYHWCGELDFIFYTEATAAVRGIVQVQAEERLVAKRLSSHPSRSLPHPDWPSDHVSLIADFELMA
eukprot:TRINITY_DN13691_c0_g1_i1.p1 TRINITY_DN13691_c0_g1~~TRINITY_DN13691_c0_g1_i1.p1  ORF type:complete len:576 (+),score=133.71 TRINITY_DN13691_c0_g1_i1:81-1808(+)